MLSEKAVEPKVGSRPKLIKSTGREPCPLGDLVVDGVVTVTPELAFRIVQEASYERQRPIRKKHVAVLARQMERHEWTSGTQIHFGRLPDGNLILVNGYHRLHAVLEADAPIAFQLLITDVANDRGLDELYRRHDRLAAPRTISDALLAEGIDERFELRSGVANACFRAIPLIESNFRMVQHYGDPYLMRSDEARLRVAENWWPTAVIVQAAIQGAPREVTRFLRSAGCMAVALLTVRWQEVKGYAFWQGFAENDRLGRKDARAVLLRSLTRSRHRTEVQTAKLASVAWNAFYRDEEVEILRISDGPVRLLGVPPLKS